MGQQCSNACNCNKQEIQTEREIENEKQSEHSHDQKYQQHDSHKKNSANYQYEVKNSDRQHEESHHQSHTNQKYEVQQEYDQNQNNNYNSNHVESVQQEPVQLTYQNDNNNNHNNNNQSNHNNNIQQNGSQAKFDEEQNGQNGNGQQDQNYNGNEQRLSTQEYESKSHKKYMFDQNDMPQAEGLSNVREKRPPYTFKSGAVYTGDWKGHMRDGYGIQSWPDGAKYEGDWLNNKAHGKGKFYHVDGDVFEGEWEYDKANGFGKYLHVNGAKYEGNWKDDLQHGWGVEAWNDGSEYKGHYVHGRKQGKGTYTWSDGSKYEGDWDNNKICGKGVYIWADGRQYEGDWLNNNMHGKGLYTWKDGRRYEGEYHNDKKHGYGVYRWADGRKYEGEWKNGKQHGFGKYILLDGTERLGYWEEGKRLRWVTAEELKDKSNALNNEHIQKLENNANNNNNQQANNEGNPINNNALRQNCTPNIPSPYLTLSDFDISSPSDPPVIGNGPVSTSAYTFDGTQTVSKSAETFGGSLTFAVWARFENSSMPQYETVFRFYNLANGKLIWMRHVSNTMEMFATTDTGYMRDRNGVLAANVWNHWGMVYDDSTQTFRLFQNGVMYSEITGVGAIETVAREYMFIGTYHASSYRFIGSIDEFYVFNSALSDDQVMCLADKCSNACLTCQNYSTCLSCRYFANLDSGACNCIDNFTFNDQLCVQDKQIESDICTFSETECDTNTGMSCDNSSNFRKSSQNQVFYESFSSARLGLSGGGSTETLVAPSGWTVNNQVTGSGTAAYKGWNFSYTSNWSSSSLQGRENFLYNTCNTIAVADSGQYTSGTFDISLTSEVIDISNREDYSLFLIVQSSWGGITSDQTAQIQVSIDGEYFYDIFSATEVSSEPDYKTGPAHETLKLQIKNLKEYSSLQIRFVYKTVSDNQSWWGVGKVGLIEWQCLDNYYMDKSSNTCVGCSYQCGLCDDHTQCSSCSHETRENAPSCGCKQGYYNIIGTQACSQCDGVCLSCETSSGNCTACKNTENRQNFPSCACESGFEEVDGACKEICGDGVVLSSLSQCDDGNSDVGDGCSDSCQVEAGYQCTGSPSVCREILEWSIFSPSSSLQLECGSNFISFLVVFSKEVKVDELLDSSLVSYQDFAFQGISLQQNEYVVDIQAQTGSQKNFEVKITFLTEIQQNFDVEVKFQNIGQIKTVDGMTLEPNVKEVLQVLKCVPENEDQDGEEQKQQQQQQQQNLQDGEENILYVQISERVLGGVFEIFLIFSFFMAIPYGFLGNFTFFESYIGSLSIVYMLGYQKVNTAQRGSSLLIEVNKFFKMEFFSEIQGTYRQTEKIGDIIQKDFYSSYFENSMVFTVLISLIVLTQAFLIITGFLLKSDGLKKFQSNYFKYLLYHSFMFFSFPVLFFNSMNEIYEGNADTFDFYFSICYGIFSLCYIQYTYKQVKEDSSKFMKISSENTTTFNNNNEKNENDRNGKTEQQQDYYKHRNFKINIQQVVFFVNGAQALILALLKEIPTVGLVMSLIISIGYSVNIVLRNPYSNLRILSQQVFNQFITMLDFCLFIGIANSDDYETLEILSDCFVYVTGLSLIGNAVYIFVELILGILEACGNNTVKSKEEVTEEKIRKTEDFYVQQKDLALVDVDSQNNLGSQREMGKSKLVKQLRNGQSQFSLEGGSQITITENAGTSNFKTGESEIESRIELQGKNNGNKNLKAKDSIFRLGNDIEIENIEDKADSVQVSKVPQFPKINQ